MEQELTDEPNPWQIVSAQPKYENPWIEVTEYGVINPAGGEGIYGKVHFKNRAIGVIPVDADGNTWLVGQYRFPLGTYSWEIIEGGAPLFEAPLISAKRELEEEAGLQAADWTLLLEADLSNSVSDEQALIYLARGIREGKSRPEDTEKLQIRKVSLIQVFEWLDAGKFRDSLTIMGLLKLRHEIQLKRLDI